MQVYSQRCKDKAKSNSPNKYHHHHHKFQGLSLLADVASLITIPNQSDSVARVTRRAGPQPPPCFQDKIDGLNGQDLKLVIEKKLTKTDVKPYFARLAIP